MSAEPKENGDDLKVSDLGDSKSELKQVNLDECSSTESEIEAARFDLQNLMTRAHAYCKTSGVASGSAILPNGAPRRNSCSVIKKRRKSSSAGKLAPGLQ